MLALDNVQIFQVRDLPFGGKSLTSNFCEARSFGLEDSWPPILLTFLFLGQSFANGKFFTFVGFGITHFSHPNPQGELPIL